MALSCISKLTAHFRGVAIALCLLMSSAALAESLITLTISTPAISFGALSKPAATDTVLIWIGDGKARMDVAKNVSTVYNARTDSTLKIFHKFGIYSDGSSTLFGLAPDSAGASDLAAGLAALSPKMVTTVEATPERKIINGWNCTRWIQRDSMPLMGAVLITDFWATEDANIDIKLYQNIANANLKALGTEESLREQCKIKGLPILCIARMQCDSTSIMPNLGSSRTEILSIKAVTVPADHYEIPEGYELYK